MATTDMSSDELRAHLYRSLQGKGILDSLKSQLRNRLATELQMSMKAPSSPSRKSKPASSSDSSLTTGHSHHTISVQVANSIVAEHLKKSGYEYSLSVFLPEGGVSVEKLLTVEEILHYLRIKPSSPLYQALKSSDHQCGFLVHLFDSLIETGQSSTSGVESKQSACVQTDDSELHQEGSGAHFMKPSVADQLKAVDQSYAQKAKEETEKVNHSILERIGRIQSELEARYKKQLESELSLYRTRELAKVRLEEREKYSEEMSREKTQLNQDHQRKIDELRRNEQHIVDQYRLKEQELESSIYSQRQALLGELESIRRKEEERKRQIEISRKSIDVEEQRLKAVAEELENQRKKLQQVTEEKAQRHKQEIESNFRTRETELKRREAELQVTHQAATTFKSDNQKLMDELKEEKEKNNRLQALLHETTNRQIFSEKHKDSMAQKLNEMADYQSVKQRNLELQHQLTAANKKLSETKIQYKQRNSEQQQLIKSLQTRLSNPNPELLAMKVEIEQLQRTHEEEMIVFECDNKELRKQLSMQTEYCQELQKHLDNQMLQLRTAQREVDDLRQILEHVKVTVKPTTVQVENGVGERKAKIEAKRPLRTSKKTAKNQPPSHQLHHQHATNTTSTGTTVKSIPILHTSMNHNRPHATFGETHNTVSFSDASAQFLAETRETFARLEKEAKELEKSYQSVRHPASSSSSLIAPLFDAMPKPQYTFANQNVDLNPFGLDLSLSSTVTTVTSIQSPHSPVSDENETFSPKYTMSPPVPNYAVNSSGNVPNSLLSPLVSLPVVTSYQTPAPAIHMHLPTTSTSQSSAPLLPVTSTTPLLSVSSSTVQTSALSSLMTSIHGSLHSSIQPVTSNLPAPSQFFTPVSISLTTQPPTLTEPGVDEVVVDDTKDEHSSSLSSESEVVSKKQPTPMSASVATTKPVNQRIEMTRAQTVVSNQSASGSGPSSAKQSVTKISLDDWWKSPTPKIHPSPPVQVHTNTIPSDPVDGGIDQGLIKNFKELHTANGTVKRSTEEPPTETMKHSTEEPPAETASNGPVQAAMKVSSEHSVHVDAGASDKGDNHAREDPQITVEPRESQGSTDDVCKSGDDGIDPVMLKYMEIVSRKREELFLKEKRGQQKTDTKENIVEDKDSPHDREIDVPTLSQVSEGFGGFSDDGDPFEDW